jgi:chromosome segregation ATPase
MPDEVEAEDQASDLRDLLSGNLADGRVVVEIETKDAMRYRVERSPADGILLFDQDGKPTSFNLPGPLFSAEVYSQNEVEEIAKNPRFQLNLLDKFIREEKQSIEGQIDEITTQLGINSDRIQSSQRELDELRDKLSELPDVEEKLKAVERSDDGDEDDELRTEHGAKTLRDQQEERIVEIAAGLAGLRAELESVADSARQYTQSLDTADVASGPNKKLMESLGSLSRHTLDGAIEKIESLCADLEAGESKAEELSVELRFDHVLQDQLYRKVLDRFEQAKGRARERALLLRRQAELQKLATRQTKVEGDLKRCRKERQKLIKQLVELRDQRYQARVRVAEHLNERLAPMIQVRVEQSGNTDSYRQLLTELMYNSGLPYGSLVQKAKSDGRATSWESSRGQASANGGRSSAG